jgi:hypothetical protein
MFCCYQSLDPLGLLFGPLFDPHLDLEKGVSMLTIETTILIISDASHYIDLGAAESILCDYRSNFATTTIASACRNRLTESNYCKKCKDEKCFHFVVLTP